MNLFRLLMLVLCFGSAMGQLPSQDILALLEFRKGINHDPTGYVLQSWNEESIDFNGCPSSWNGIMCNGGNVAAVVLDNMDLSADADLSVFANLTMLVKLSMANNSIAGQMPKKIGDFKSLEYLDISNNLFNSSLPPEIGKIGSLKNLSLAEFLLLTTATYVDLSGNLLASSASQHEKFLPGISSSVKYLSLSHNQLTGSLVSGGEAQAFGNLKVLDLSYNQLSGELPGFNFVYDLQVLKLSNNRFSGFVPNDLLKGGALVLAELDLSGNNLTGSISMITSTTLRVLNLSSNALSGELPLVTGSTAVLDLSKNQLEGNLTRIQKWGNVEFLDLSQNQLTGNIPEVTAQFLRLNRLNLSHNALTGSLPKVITQFPKITVLDLSFNQLNGPLLTSLLTLPTIEELHLQNNALVGNIDFAAPSATPNLRVLDLSHNQLAGSFPDGFGLLTALQLLDIAGNNFSGSLPTLIGQVGSLTSLDISQNHFTGPLPMNLPDGLQSFNASLNDLSGVVPDNLRKFPLSSFYPGNSELQFPNPPSGSGQASPENQKSQSLKTIIKVVIIVSCVIALIILVLLAIFFYYIRASRKRHPRVTEKVVHRQATSNPSGFSSREGAGGAVVSAEDLMTSRKGSSEIISPDEKMAAITGFSPSKGSHFSWSPESGDSYTAETFARLDVKSPDRLAGELYFLDDTISFTPEELSRAPAEVLGRSSHGTSYRATLENGLLLTVKWLREGVAKQRKDFAKEAKKFANIRHPNVVGLRGYYWGPTQHEKLILSDYISPGSLASFLYDRPGRKGPPLTWPQRLKISVDVARGLNYLHFDREVPHGNLKATNILLDGPDLNARVADYCLHRLMTQAGTIEQILDAGVLGYRAPELAASKKPLPSFKSDVYAFGVILLELLSGKCAGDVVSGEDGGVDLTDWVRLKVAEGRSSDCFDNVLSPELGNPAMEKQMKEVLGIAVRCIRSISERPGIKTIYEDLSSI